MDSFATCFPSLEKFMKTRHCIGFVMIFLCWEMGLVSFARADPPTPEEMALARQWAAAHFERRPTRRIISPSSPSLTTETLRPNY